MKDIFKSVMDVMNIPESYDNIEKFISVTLFIYLAVYFLVPYKPWDAPISFHTPVLLLGLTLSLFKAIQVSREGRWVASREFVCLIIAAVLFLISSFLVNQKDSSFAIAQAYSLSFLCLFFVGATVNGIDRRVLYSWMRVYLLISGVLVVLQVGIGGPFYVATHFGIESPPKGAAGWGFAGSHIFAGGAISWMLCVLLAEYVFPYDRAPGATVEVMSLAALGMGGIGLFYTFNRGAWVAVLAAVFILWIGLIRHKLPYWRLLKGLIVISVAILLVQVFVSPTVSRMDSKLASVTGIVKAPTQVLSTDASTVTRLKAWGLSVSLIKSYPIWGVGGGRFPQLYSQAFSEMYKGISVDKFDPYPIQTSSNSFFYYAVEMGLLPAVFLGTFIVMSFYKVANDGAGTASYPFLIGGIAVVIWLMTCDYIGERIFWIVLGTVAGPSMPSILKTFPYGDFKSPSLKRD